MHWALPKQWVFWFFFFKCPVSLEITVMFNANIFAGTGELQNRKRLTGLVGVGRESRCNIVRGVVTWPRQRIDLLKLKCTCTTLINPPAQCHTTTQHKKQKIQKKQKQNKNTPLSQIRNKKNKPLKNSWYGTLCRNYESSTNSSKAQQSHCTFFLIFIY